MRDAVSRVQGSEFKVQRLKDKSPIEAVVARLLLSDFEP
jgi:hypothetical protein